MFSSVLLRDKSDLVGVENIIPNAHVVGAMEKSDHISVEDIKVISTKFTKVGKTMLERYPNLQWVVHRAHGTDGINLELCEKYGVGVVTTSPHTEACATWIKDRLVYGNTIIFGNGSISKRVQEIIDEWYLIEGLEYSVVNSSVKVINLNNHYKNVVSCVPLNDETENMFNYELFKNVNDMNFVSISRDKTHNNKDLLKLIKENKFKKLYIDTLGTEHREELIDTGIVDYTKHTAWVSEKDDLLELKTIIQDCLADDVTNPILERRKNVFFQF